MNDVSVKLGADSSGLDQELDKTKASISAWSGTIKASIAAIGAGFALKKVFDLGASFVGGAAEEAEAYDKLSVSLKNNGDTAGFTIEQFSKLASEAQKYNGVADDVYIANAAIITGFDNIRGMNIDRTIKAAADVARIMGDDVSSASKKLGRALQDPVKGMELLKESGVNFTTEQKELIESLSEAGDVAGAQEVIFKQLNDTFGGASEAAQKTFSGRIEQIKMSIGDMGESIGGVLIPALESLLPVVETGVSMLTRMFAVLSGSSEATQEAGDSWSNYFVESLKTAVMVGTDTYSFFEWFFSNFGSIVERTTTNAALSFTTFALDIEYLFTEKVPAYISWFFDNWQSMLFDFANFQFTVFNNMSKNIGAFFTGVWGMLKGEGFTFEWTGLTDGFEATMKALPEIAERELSGTEKALASQISAIDEQLGSSMNDIFKKNREFMNSTIIDPAAEDLKIEPEISTEPFKSFEKAAKDAGKAAKGATTVGLEDLSKSITEATKERIKLKDSMSETKDLSTVSVSSKKKADTPETLGKSTRHSIDDLYSLLADHHTALLRSIDASGGLA
jgi:hypothetical protein